MGVTRHSSAAARLGVLSLVGLVSLVGGCGARWRPAVHAAQSRPAVERFSIEPYLRAWRTGRGSYQREQLTQRDGTHPQPYPRVSDRTRMSEGRLVGRPFLPLERYLHPLLPAESALADEIRPMPPLQGGTALMFELAEPMEPIPPQLTAAEAITSTTSLRYYDYDGRPLTQGTLTREVEIEGVEDVDCPAGHYPGCLRVRLDLAVRLPWVISLDWTSYLWLSAQVGEVRRVQHMSGWFLIFRFSSTYRYELVSGGPIAVAQPQALPPPRWKYGAVLLDSTVPRPQIAGMVVDYADNSTPASAPTSTTSTSLTTRPAAR